MSRLSTALLTFLVLARAGFADGAPALAWTDNAAAFAAETDRIRERLGISGLALAVVREGEVIDRRGFGVDRDGIAFTPETPLRFASVTKALTAVLVQQAARRGVLRLSDRVRDRLAGFPGPEEVTIRHLLTHTSEGLPGEEYVYGTSRFSLLTEVLEKASRRPFEELLRRDILDPAGMTWRPSPHLGAHAGLVSTVDDMARFAMALDEGLLLGPQRLAALATPSVSSTGRVLPIGLGWFAQTVQGRNVAWSYGQDDPDHSGALLLRVPDRGFTCVLLASSNVISDPFRLLMGDVRKSPFAMAFLRNFVFSPAGHPLSAPEWGVPAPQIATDLDRLEASSPGYRYADEILSNAIVHAWTGQGDAARDAFALWAARYTERAQTPDPVILFFATALKQEPLLTLGAAMAEGLVAEHPRNRWVLLHAGELYLHLGQEEEAAALFRRILSLPNQHADFLHRLFAAWSRLGLARCYKEKDVEKARGYLREVIDSGVSGQTLEHARQLLGQIEP